MRYIDNVISDFSISNDEDWRTGQSKRCVKNTQDMEIIHIDQVNSKANKILLF